MSIKINKNEVKLLFFWYKRIPGKKFMWVFCIYGTLRQFNNDPQVYLWPMNDFSFYSGLERPERE